MPRAASARRYAEAIFNIAREQNRPEQWLSDLQDVAQALKDPLCAGVLESLKVPFETKRAMLTEAFPSVNPLVLNLVYLLVGKGRLRILHGIVEEYGRLLDAHKGIEHARVITAIPLEEADKRQLAGVLSSISSKQVVLAAEVDPSIIGGMIVHLGDKVIDGSVRGRLGSLKKRLAEAAP